MTTVKELKKLTKAKNLKGYSKMKEDKLLRILNMKMPVKRKAVKDLRKIAKERNTISYYKMKKLELINILYPPVLALPEPINETFPFEDTLYEPE